MEEVCGKKFGDLENPLLVSVRSGSRASMPGMMDTILNLGLNEEVVNVIATKSGNPHWAWDCYRRFIKIFSDVVMEVGKKYFEKLIDEMKKKKGVEFDVDLAADDLKELANQFKAEYKNKIGADFPSHRVGKLMEMAVEKGKKVRSNLHCGICGEHGGDSSSIEFCHKIGVNYVSCSPFRVPIARLSAAQAAIRESGK